jgi:hypothetical protein
MEHPRLWPSLRLFCTDRFRQGDAVLDRFIREF